MKVLYLIDSLQGYGAEKSLVEILVRFKEIRPVVVELYPGGQLIELLTKNGVKVYSLNLRGKYNFSLAIKKVLAIIEKENPSILHSTLFRADFVARQVKKQVPNLVLIGSFVSNSYSTRRYKTLGIVGKIKLLLVQQLDSYSSRHVDFFISNSEAIKDPNIRALGISKDKVKVIPRGRSCQEGVAPGISGNNKDSNEIVFLNISRLDKRKGQLDLVKGFKKFNEEHPSSKLLLAGEGRLRIELEALVENFRLQENVILLGYKKDIWSLLEIADFFIFPSYYEGLPGSLIEAILSKTPVLASDIPENRECLTSGSALFFEPGNVEEIYLKMEEAINTDWSTMTEAACQFAKEHFDINQVSKRYEEFYREVFSSVHVRTE